MFLKVIVNPTAGAGRSLRVWQRVKESLRRLERPVLRCRTFYPGSPAQARRLARQAAAEGFDAIIVIGGDGTINEVAAGTLENGLPLAIVPAGTGNAFARSLGQVTVPRDLCRALREGRIRRLDVGTVGNRVFVNMAGIGFDSEVLRGFRRNRLVRGIPGYVMTGLQMLPVFRPPCVSIAMPGARLTARTTLVAICNGPYYGGGLKMAPHADMTDGLLDICVMEHLTAAEVFAMWSALYSGQHVRHPKVKILRAAEFRLESETPLQYHCDGDLAGYTPCAVRVLPQALPVIA